MAIQLIAQPVSPQTPPTGTPQDLGVVSGRVTDESGAAVPGADIVLVHVESLAQFEVVSRADGRFSFDDVPAGVFRLTVSAAGFATRTLPGALMPGDHSDLPPIRLTLSIGTISVQVTPTQVELAEQQIKEQEKQRLFGIVPNFRVSYRADAVPLNARQKFQLTWKSVADPARFAGVGLAAAIQHVRNDFGEFGSGPDGYARRYGALYATIVTGTMISQVILPTIFRQDPRYFYNGQGTIASRVGYALSRAVVRKADNGRWQPDYSRVLGSFLSGAISNYYYPEGDRRRLGLTLGNAAIGIGGAAAGNLMQEFLLKRLTTRSRQTSSAIP